MPKRRPSREAGTPSDDGQPPRAIARWLRGRRTYLTAAAILICGALSASGIKVPEYVWAALAALGLGFLRAGVKKG